MVPKARVLDVEVDCLTVEQVLAMIEETVLANRRMLIGHTNITGLNIAYRLPWYKDFLNGVDLLYCDGVGVQWGARILGEPVPPRFTLPDWIGDLARLGVANDISIYFLGNPPGAAEKAAESLASSVPGFQIIGTQHGYFDKTPGHPENLAVIDKINQASPGILLVGFGMPLQERWLLENWEHLHVNVAITCGALFEYMSGYIERGPRWMTDHGMEWLSRVLITPQRSFRRYARDIPLFLYRVFKQKLVQKEG